MSLLILGRKRQKLLGIRWAKAISRYIGIGDILGPASMLSIGISVSAIKHVGREKFSKLLTVTLMAIILALRLNTLLPDAPHILLITLLGAGAPTGVVVSQIAQLYEKDAQYASLIGIVTMLCSIVTLPMLILSYETAAAIF